MSWLLQAIKAVRARVARTGLAALLMAMWRVLRTRGIRSFLERTRFQIARFQSESASYEAWLTRNALTEPMLETMRQRCTTFRDSPLFSVVMPVYNVREEWLREAIESVTAQIYPRWELCIADDASTEAHVRPLLQRYAAADPRIKVAFREKNGHICAATNTALELAAGDYICLMDNDDKVSPDALYEFAGVIQAKGRVGMIYSDEDKLSKTGERYEPFFKPDWSPEYLEACFYTAHFACYRADIVRKSGGFRVGYEGAQDYDFALRFVEQRPEIVHVAKVLYHWRSIKGSTATSMQEKDYVIDAACKVLRDHLSRSGVKGSVRPGAHAASFEVRYEISGTPLVSIVIPTAGRNAAVRGKSVDLLVNCISSIRHKTSYRNYEIVVVDNNDLKAETLAGISNAGCRFVHFTEPFNVAKKMNLGAAVARGDYLVFLNDDVEVIEPTWLEDMLQLAQRAEIGAVGAKLFYEDGTLQHAGVTFDDDGLPDHIFQSYPGNFPGYYFSCVSTRNFLAVTGACLMTRTEAFRRVGGFDEEFPINYNDIDYCLRIGQAGLRVVLCPRARLYHFESKNRERIVEPEAIGRFKRRWSALTRDDPFYGRMFDRKPPNFRLLAA